MHMHRYTPLHWAAHEGYENVSVALIERNADVATVDKNGFTALQCAATESHKDVCLALIALNADVEVADAALQELLHKATERQEWDFCIMVLQGKNERLSNALLDAGLSTVYMMMNYIILYYFMLIRPARPNALLLVADRQACCGKCARCVGRQHLAGRDRALVCPVLRVCRPASTDAHGVRAG